MTPFCPSCKNTELYVSPDTEGGRHYLCLKCEHTWATVEVPEPYLRDLIDRSLELAALKAKN